MVRSDQNFEAELRIPLKWVIVTLFVAGMVMIIVADTRIGVSERLKVMFFGALFYAAAGAAWSLHLRQSWQGRVMAIVALILLLNLGFGWLGISGFLLLMSMPIILAADPLTAVVKGVGIILENFERYKKILKLKNRR